jgi:5-methyltetrahydrofolate--homocysteine methyltransferase
METKVTSATREVIISDQGRTAIIGERINPTGRKKMQEALQSGNLDIIATEARQQVAAGADVIDCNVSTIGVDDVAMMPRAIKIIMETVDAPICLDCTNPDALEAGLKVYKGKPIINSVSGEEKSLTRVLPLVKKYGAAVIGLVQDDEGIPNSAERRLQIARKIVSRANAAGIPSEDIIIDVETFSLGADPSSGPKVLGGIAMIKAELGVNITLAASNISFGMPDRGLLNNAFAAMAIQAGVTCLIADANRILPSVLAADLVMAKDKRARRYIEAFRKRQALLAQQKPA